MGITNFSSKELYQFTSHQQCMTVPASPHPQKFWNVCSSMVIKWCLVVSCNLHHPSNAGVSTISNVCWLICSCSANCPVPLPSLPLDHLPIFSWFIVVLCIFWTVVICLCMTYKNLLLVCASLVHYVPDQIKCFTFNAVK